MHRHAQAHHARVLDLYDPQRSRELLLRFSVDPAVVAGVRSGWSLWLAGWPARAQARLLHGLRRARELAHPYSRCLAGVNAAWVYLWCGALAEAERLAAEAGRVAQEHGLTLFRVRAEIVHACVRIQRGEPEAGLARLTAGVAAEHGLGGQAMRPLYLACMADACGQLGRVEEGLATLAEATRLTETCADVSWAAEVARLTGVLRLTAGGQALPRPVAGPSALTHRAGPSQGGAGPALAAGSRLPSRVVAPQADGEAWVQHALALARQQEAKSLELRAAMSLAACGSSRASGRPLGRCWRRSMAGSPRALIRPTYRTPRCCWRHSGANRHRHPPPRPPWAHPRHSGVPPRVAANPDTKQACL